MIETTLIIVFVILALLVAAFISATDVAKNPPEIREVKLECTQQCRHEDCKYHSHNVDGYTTKTNLMWSMACPYYTWREDIDDPEG